MENILTNTIKENLNENKDNKVLILDNLTENLYYSIPKRQYNLVMDRLDLYFKNIDYLNLFVSYELQFINVDFIKNDKLMLCIELNFNDNKFIEKWINKVLDNYTNPNKIKNFEYSNKKQQTINLKEFLGSF